MSNKICLICGNRSDRSLCDDCWGMTDIEKLCLELSVYNPNKCQNALWNDIAAGLDSPYDLCNIVYELTEDMPSPRKEYLQMMRMSRCGKAVQKAFRDKFFILYESVANAVGLTETELLTIKGLAFNAFVGEYSYDEAESVCDSIRGISALPLNTAIALADYYIKTRRYSLADNILNTAVQNHGENEELMKLIKDCDSRRNGKKEYMPSPKNAQEIYKKFMEKIGIEIAAPRKKSSVPVPIPAALSPP